MLEGSPVAPRNVNDVSFVARINHESAFRGRHIIFGDVVMSLFVAGAVFGEISVDRQSASVVIFRTKCVSEARKVTSANGRVRDDEFMVGSCSNRPPLSK